MKLARSDKEFLFLQRITISLLQIISILIFYEVINSICRKLGFYHNRGISWGLTMYWYFSWYSVIVIGVNVFIVFIKKII
jgi:hypothetical protein